ncbi:chromosome partitioning protein ParB [Lentzea sp. CA-135723]|uniref:chromosome partitioning protein ParB n=1 Tax=Lentzea sp. CA-135723 TaxID=3239950 RepID=UPI003D8BB198
MKRDTGFPAADAESDFLRARRSQVMSRLATWLRREPDDVNIMLPFHEVVDALGMASEKRLGLQSIRLDSIVGSVDRTRDFDRRFRPTSGRVRERWQRLAQAARRGEPVPPIEVYRVGELHFIIDGHHRVSVAHALGQQTIDAYVTQVITRLNSSGIRYRGDLIVKDYRRLFLDRVPLTGESRAAVVLSDPWHYAQLGEHVEAWGFRLMQDTCQFLDRAEVARRWYADEYRPVVAMLKQADMVGDRTETEAYMWVAAERYRLIRTHRWDAEVINAVREETRAQTRTPRT